MLNHATIGLVLIACSFKDQVDLFDVIHIQVWFKTTLNSKILLAWLQDSTDLFRPEECSPHLAIQITLGIVCCQISLQFRLSQISALFAVKSVLFSSD